MPEHIQRRIGWQILTLILASATLMAPDCAVGQGSLSAASAGWHPASAPLMTRWAKLVSPSNALKEYPRPQMVRTRWQSLNGLWDYALTDAGATDVPVAYTGKILVPYPYESALSGVGKVSIPDQCLWYQHTFTVPTAWRSGGQRVLLHFGAVNYDSQVWVNGTELGKHEGGYDAFDFDITDALKPGDNTLIVSAQNPLRSDTADAQVLGKQRLHPGGIFYTAATGIWQSVWLEPVPAAHITGLTLTPDIDHETLHVKVDTDGPPQSVTVTALDGTHKAFVTTGKAGTDITLLISHPHFWSPDDPYLYNLRVSLDGKDSDSVYSYFAMRKVSLGKDTQDRTCILLNNKPLLQIGMLDQGYWPDGIYTAPTDEALKYDIQMAKKLGFNLLRKHAKVEPDRWYYWTDRLGMLVWQDMPQCFAGRDNTLTDAAKAQWLVEWQREVATHINHPSIIVWTTFNEGWGQHDTEQIVTLTKQWDPSRLVNNASGWNDMHVGDIQDTHDYPGPGSGTPEPTRAAVNGEFGGVTMRVPDHMWTTDVVGYGQTLSQGWQVTQKYQDLLKNAYSLSKDRGTCAFVYTQITDVEQESNGIMTYDRAVVKPIPEIITAANQGKFLPLPPQPQLPVNTEAKR